MIHDYAGHAFPIQLSRKLASKGYQVMHVYAGYNVTPKGPLQKIQGDPRNFFIQPLFIREPLQKYSFLRRWLQENEYGRLLSKQIEKFQPDVMISAQTPLDAQANALRTCVKNNVRFIYWLQDIVSIATDKLLRKKFSIFGGIIGEHYIRMQKQLLELSDKIVLITDDFCPILRKWGIDQTKFTVIPNWAPISDLTPVSKNNPWSSNLNIVDRFCFMYSGTLGLKHNPNLLFQLALHYEKNLDINLVVISEGPGADWLKTQKEKHNLNNLILLKYQSFDKLSDVLGSADVLIAILEPDAGIFSVPSKVLTYLCAKRPILLSVPPENLAAKIVKNNNAGIVIAPEKTQQFLKAADMLYTDKNYRDLLASNGRNYAEKNFYIDEISEQFEQLL
jgi:glycosyltransferase involved in cell wall biosynthesis